MYKTKNLKVLFDKKAYRVVVQRKGEYVWSGTGHTIAKLVVDRVPSMFRGWLAPTEGAFFTKDEGATFEEMPVDLSLILDSARKSSEVLNVTRHLVCEFPKNNSGVLARRLDHEDGTPVFVNELLLTSLVAICDSSNTPVAEYRTSKDRSGQTQGQTEPIGLFSGGDLVAILMPLMPGAFEDTQPA